MKIKNIFFYLLFGFSIVFSCKENDSYKKDLLSNNQTKIMVACYEVGLRKDTSAVKNLLNKALDPRISHNIRFKGMTVNYSRLMALQQISDYEYDAKIDQFKVDTIATLFYKDWAIARGYIKSASEIDINYLKK